MASVADEPMEPIRSEDLLAAWGAAADADAEAERLRGALLRIQVLATNARENLGVAPLGLERIRELCEQALSPPAKEG